MSASPRSIEVAPAAAGGLEAHASRLRNRTLLALLLGAIGLRPQLVGIGPLIPQLRTDLGLSHAEAGLLSTIPILCMGAFALLAPLISQRFGSRMTVAACLALLVVAGLARAAAPTAVTAIAVTILIGVGIGVAGTLLPAFVKERFTIGSAFATGIYTTAIQLGSSVSVLVAVPLALLLGGWRASLAVLAVAGIGALVGWVVLTRDPGPWQPPKRADDRALLAPLRFLRSPIALWLAVIFWLTALPFYGLITWLPAAYVEHGWSEMEAGELTALVSFCGLPVAFVVGWVADRIVSRRVLLVALTLTYMVGAIGLIVAVDWAWAFGVIAGGSLGGLFTLAMTLPLDAGHDPAQTSAITGVMLAIGYLLTALTPITLGVVRDLTGSYTTSFWIMVLAGVVLLAVCAPLTQERLRRERPLEVAPGART